MMNDVPADGSAPMLRPRPWATSVSYDAARDEISLVLDRGARLVVPRCSVAELRDLPAARIHDLTLIGDGEALASEADDVHVFVPGLVRDLIGDVAAHCVTAERAAR